MEIRSVTLFCEPTAVSDPETINQLTSFTHEAKNSFPYPVQTIRAATTPFPDWWPTEPTDSQAVKQHAQQLARQFQTIGADYVSLGKVALHHDSKWLHAVTQIIASSGMLFASVEIADENGRIHPARCHQLAHTIKEISTLQEHPDGFGNLYLTAVANCPPGSPFFPVACHRGGDPHFALAVEAADIALQAIESATTLAEARANLVAAIETAATHITPIADQLAQKYGIPFSGIDFSLAPFPEDGKSLGGAMEALGIPHVGAQGSLFAAGFITDALERASFPRCGFSGLMLPVLEDSVLAHRAAEGLLTVQDLLSYSAVCGVGLDTVPLAGDVLVKELTAVLLDTAMLATRLNKPLTARLMPIPGLNVGDKTRFDFPYFANSRVLPIIGSGVQGLLNSHEPVSINQIQTTTRGFTSGTRGR